MQGGGGGDSRAKGQTKKPVKGKNDNTKNQKITEQNEWNQARV